MAIALEKGLGLSWNLVFQRGKRLPIEDSTLNHSYAHLLWELNQDNSIVPNTSQANKGGSGNFYVGHITSIPYAWGENGAYTKAKYPENTLDTKGPWYVTYCDTDEDPNPGVTGKYAFPGHGKNGNGNTYYADRIVLRQELDYALDNNYVNKYQLGTYYTGVGLWWDSWQKSREYIENNKEVSDGTYFESYTYGEIFNDYAYNRAEGAYSHAEGYHTYTLGDYSKYAHTEGCYTIALAYGAHAEGIGTIVYFSDDSYDGKSYPSGAHAEGLRTIAYRTAAHAEGRDTIAYGRSSHAEGRDTIAYGDYSHAEGYETITYGNCSHVEGLQSIAYGANSHVSGSYNVAYGANSHVSGSYNVAYGDYSHAEGYETIAYGDYSHAEGRDTIAYGDYSHAEGYETITYGNCSHVEGLQSIAYGANSHVSGSYNVAYGANSHVSGSYNVAYGDYSHAEGYTTIAYGGSSHAEGAGIAYGECSHAEGAGIAYGECSHAEGAGIAYGAWSHAEGSNTIAYGGNSHAEGSNTIAYGWNSHAEGYTTIAYGAWSHAEGRLTKTTNEYEHAEGIYNQSYTGSQSGSLFEIGDGTADIMRHNVISVLRNGAVLVDSRNNAYIAARDDISINGKKTVHITSPGTYITSPHVTIGDPAQTARGENSVTIGNKNTATNQASVAIGQSNNSNGQNSVLLGTGLLSNEYSKVSVGKYNKSYTEGIFEVGIGTDNNNRKNAFTTYTTGVTYFHYQPYTYDSYINSVTYGSWDGNAYTKYSPSDYPDESCVVSQSYLRLSYDTLYKTTKTVIDNLASVDSMQSLDDITRSYTDNVLHYTTGHYDQTQEKYITSKHTIQQESATKELAGLMSGEDKVRSDDLEDRLNAVVKAASLPTFRLNTVTWKVYNNDKSKVLATYNNVTSITAEYGTYVTAENYTIKMNLNANYDASFLATVTTKGPFGTKVPSFSPIVNGSALMEGSNSLALTYISPYTGGVKSKNVTTTSQTVRAVTQFGMKYLSTRKLANGNMQVYRLNDPDTYSEGNGFNISVSGKFGIIKWYGTTNTNPATFPSSMTQAALEAYMTGQHNAVSSNTNVLTYKGKTDDSHKYFFYVYRKALGNVTSVESKGANATGWFNTGAQKTITITKTTTGMKEDYYLIYTMNENGLSKGDELTFR